MKPREFLKNPLNTFIKNLKNADEKGMDKYINNLIAIVNGKWHDEITKLRELGASLPRGEYNQDLQILSRSLKTFPDHMESELDLLIQDCKKNYQECRQRKMNILNDQITRFEVDEIR